MKIIAQAHVTQAEQRVRLEAALADTMALREQQVAPLKEMRAQLGTNHRDVIKQQLTADVIEQKINALRAALARSPLASADPAPTSSPATADPDPPTAGTNLRDLPPAVAAQLRLSWQQQLIRLIGERDDQQMAVDDLKRRVGLNSPELAQASQKIDLYDRRIKGLQTAIAQPLPVSPEIEADATVALPYVGPWLGWFDRHFAALYLSLVGGCLLAAILLRHLVRRGEGRTIVLSFFALMLAIGLAELFAAGVAMGLGRPPAAWATLLGCAAIAILIPALQLPQVRRQYADSELRKMRAMDVG